MQTNKSVTEIIAGALEIFTRGSRGGLRKKAAWNNYTLEDNETYCALGALSKSAVGHSNYSHKGNLGKAADLVASCIPESIRENRGIEVGEDIPEWNDNLSATRGFVSIKRAFCKALKLSMKQEKGKRRKKAA